MIINLLPFLFFTLICKFNIACRYNKISVYLGKLNYWIILNTWLNTYLLTFHLLLLSMLHSSTFTVNIITKKLWIFITLLFNHVCASGIPLAFQAQFDANLNLKSEITAVNFVIDNVIFSFDICSEKTRLWFVLQCWFKKN